MNPLFANTNAISASYIKTMADLVESQGGKGQALIKKAGIGRHKDNDFFSFISLEQYEVLLKEGLAATQNPALGLYLGKAIKFSDHGTFAFSALSFPTLWDAMKIGKKFSKLATQIVDLQLEESSRYHIIRLDTAYISGELYQTFIEMVMSLFCEILTFMLHEDISSVEINFCFSEPSYADQYDEVFEPSVKFNTPYNQIIIPKALAEKPQVMANAAVAKKFEQECDDLLSKLYQPKSCAQLVYEALIFSRGGFPQLDDIAEQLNISSRTLRRRLQEDETSYKKILDQVLLELANRYLTTTQLSIGEISEILGYTDQNSFSHAYKQLTGFPPTAYRKNHPQ